MVAERIFAFSQDLWERLFQNHGWQRLVKSVFAIEVTVVLCLVTPVVEIIGPAAYLGPISATLGNPGRRVGSLVEMIIVLLSFAFVGTAWGILGLYLGSLVYNGSPEAALAIRAVFLVAVGFLHGFIRAKLPRLFPGLVLMILVSAITLQSPTANVTGRSVTMLIYPVLIACATMLVSNLCIFPETSGSYLGETTIDMLHLSIEALRDAEIYFIGKGSANSQHAATRSIQGRPAEPGAGKTSHHDDSNSFATRFRRLGLMLSMSRKKSGSCSETLSDHEQISMAHLSTVKARLRKDLSTCQTVQRECSFELSWSYLSPKEMKPISSTAMKKIVANIIALIGACESRFALLDEVRPSQGEESGKYTADAPAAEIHPHQPDMPVSSASRKTRAPRLEKHYKPGREDFVVESKEDLNAVKPHREIESADLQLLNFLITKIGPPLNELQVCLDHSINMVTACVSYAYGVQSDEVIERKDVNLQELDRLIDVLDQALINFDDGCSAALKSARVLEELNNQEVDLSPREEYFLISSFVLNLRSAASQIMRMLRHSRFLVEARQHHRRKRLYLPQIGFRKWLSFGGDESGSAQTRRWESDRGKDKKSTQRRRKDSVQRQGTIDRHGETANGVLKTLPNSADFPITRKPAATTGTISTLREYLADLLEDVRDSDNALYALKLTMLVTLLTWPAFISTSWNEWYYLNRGQWAVFQGILLFEVAIGSSVISFILRFVGTTLGCLWGWAAYEAGNGNRVVCGIMIGLGLVPAVFVQLASPDNARMGVVGIISIVVVAISTTLSTNTAGATENFLRRYCAFIIGAAVALVLQIGFYPVKARTRLVESLIYSLCQIRELESCLAVGIESNDSVPTAKVNMLPRFDKAVKKADASLSAAEEFLPYCMREPRIKGSFLGLSIIYDEIIFVLRQISDKMANTMHLRQAFGSSILEKYSDDVLAYRLNLHGAITLLLFACEEALVTKYPLPQFLPSARLAHLRLINRVREVVLSRSHQTGDAQEEAHNADEPVAALTRQRLSRKKFMSWNAGAAAQAEIVEYLEELMELTKLLVGANQFRSGMLRPPNYRDHMVGTQVQDGEKQRPMRRHRRRGTTNASTDSAGGEEAVESSAPGNVLRRIQTRQAEEKVERIQSREQYKSMQKDKEKAI
ncbi:MAG: hypothetical protein M1825_005712 [Sarcosagium campestre]|nr:MAG: hypothetical protein M1825_005712 [Sarcosagium campestre]